MPPLTSIRVDTLHVPVNTSLSVQSKTGLSADFFKSLEELEKLQGPLFNLVISHKQKAYRISKMEFEQYKESRKSLVAAALKVLDLIDKLNAPSQKEDLSETEKQKITDALSSSRFTTFILDLHNTHLEDTFKGKLITVKTLEEDTRELIETDKEESKKSSSSTHDS